MLENKKILIVEDDIMNRVLYQMILEKAGAEITFVTCASSVLSKLKSVSWDLIILNLDLTYSENGYVVFDRIRENLEYQNIPVLGISSSDASIVIPKAQKLGFSGFIAKPINQYFFASQVEQVLAGHEIWNTYEYATR